MADIARAVGVPIPTLYHGAARVRPEDMIETVPAQPGIVIDADAKPPTASEKRHLAARGQRQHHRLQGRKAGRLASNPPAFRQIIPILPYFVHTCP
jgi:hypothetical protein